MLLTIIAYSEPRNIINAIGVVLLYEFFLEKMNEMETGIQAHTKNKVNDTSIQH